MCPLNSPDFLIGQAVELVDQLVDLLVSGVYLALDEGFLMVGLVDHVGLQDATPLSKNIIESAARTSAE